MIPYIRENFQNDLAIVSPDAGGVPRARAYAKRLTATLGLIDKRRDAPGKAKAMNLIGEVLGKEVVIMDDIIDTGGTLSEASGVILQNGARSVTAFCTHAVLSGPAVQRVTDSPLKRLVVTDTIPLSEAAQKCPKIVPAHGGPDLRPGHPAGFTRRIPSARCLRFSFKGKCRTAALGGSQTDSGRGEPRVRP